MGQGCLPTRSMWRRYAAQTQRVIEATSTAVAARMTTADPTGAVLMPATPCSLTIKVTGPPHRRSPERKHERASVDREVRPSRLRAFHRHCVDRVASGLCVGNLDREV